MQLSRRRGRQPARHLPAVGRARKRLFIGSHLDTVPNAGAFDGVLGVVLASPSSSGLNTAACPLTIEVVGFSEEEGVRFGMPFIGSRAVVGSGILLGRRRARSIPAIRAFGLDPARLSRRRAPAPTRLAISSSTSSKAPCSSTSIFLWES